ncbi:hypothetical protein GYMLUDRAFT_44405 [Collybiopsis luxurians FD-317 M1]|uniref:Kinesin motor domain-containing protein n=1 Tax=Collybiopsis luxurians FD-317 M1 TaxID=944289 RepID=A0A0D0B8N1_9AGAR|nr:hypothetical protein GYMLUDRAFT_44405 [Collybiopsis luxurians FD-317 M1]
MSAVHIVARLRPPLPGEVCDDGIGVVSCNDKENSSDSSNLGPGIVVFKDTTSHHYPFHSAYGSTQNTLSLFNNDILPLLDTVLTGGTNSITVFAYGVTSSGKTFTMQGNGLEDKGVTTLVVEEILGRQTDQGRVAMSYLELYLDSPFDLLSSSLTRQKLQILSTVSAGTTSGAPILSFGTNIHLPHLSIHPVESIQDFQTLYARATKNRSTGATLLNERSSRSHAVLTLYVTRSGAAAVSKIHLLDLAGSENNNLTGNGPGRAQRMKESSAINKSLTALGQVVSALNDNARTTARARKASDPNPKLKLIPYRSSALTRLLSDALDGTSLSVLVVCLAPGTKFRSDLIRSVGFASQARRIERVAEKKFPPKMVPARKSFDFKVPFGTSTSALNETGPPNSVPKFHAPNSPRKPPSKPQTPPVKQVYTRKRRASLIPIPGPHFLQTVKSNERPSGIAATATRRARESLSVSGSISVGFLITEEEIQERILKAVEIEVERRLEKIRQEERLRLAGQGMESLKEEEMEVETSAEREQQGGGVNFEAVTQCQKPEIDVITRNDEPVLPVAEVEAEELALDAAAASYEERDGEREESEEEEEEVDQLIDDDDAVVDMNVDIWIAGHGPAVPVHSLAVTSALPSVTHVSPGVEHTPNSLASPAASTLGLPPTSTPGVLSSSPSVSRKRKNWESGEPMTLSNDSSMASTRSPRKRRRREARFDSESELPVDRRRRDIDASQNPARTGKNDSNDDDSAKKVRYARAWALQAGQAQHDRNDLPQALALYRRAATFAPDNAQLQKIITSIERALETDTPLPLSPKRLSSSHSGRYSSLASGKKRAKKPSFPSKWLSSSSERVDNGLVTESLPPSSSPAFTDSKSAKRRAVSPEDTDVIEIELSPKNVHGKKGKEKIDDTTQGKGKSKGKGKARAVSLALSEAETAKRNHVSATEEDEWDVPPSAYEDLALLSRDSNIDVYGAGCSGSSSISGSSSMETPSQGTAEPSFSLPPASTTSSPSPGISHGVLACEDPMGPSQSEPSRPDPVSAPAIATPTLHPSLLNDFDRFDLDEVNEVAGTLENKPDFERGSSIEPFGEGLVRQNPPKLATGSELPGIKEEETEWDLDVVDDEESESEWEESPKKRVSEKKASGNPTTRSKRKSKSTKRPKVKKSNAKSSVAGPDAPATSEQELVHESQDNTHTTKRRMRYVYGSSDDEGEREEVFVRDVGAPVKRKRLNADKRRNKTRSADS